MWHFEDPFYVCSKGKELRKPGTWRKILRLWEGLSEGCPRQLMQCEIKYSLRMSHGHKPSPGWLLLGANSFFLFAPIAVCVLEQGARGNALLSRWHSALDEWSGTESKQEKNEEYNKEAQALCERFLKPKWPFYFPHKKVQTAPMICLPRVIKSFVSDLLILIWGTGWLIKISCCPLSFMKQETLID